jgi:hypothetical protein
VSGLLTRDQILGAKDVKTQRVSVPEWGGDVLVSTMTGAQRDAWEQSLVRLGGKGLDLTNARARLLSFCVVDEKGAPMFKPEDVTKLGEKSGIALERCAKVAQELNRLRDEDLEAAGKN